MERVRWEVSLGAGFDEPGFHAAFDGFRRLYGIRPARVLCAPDVLRRFAEVYATPEAAYGGHLAFERIPLESALVAPGTVIFEGEVDEARMGDW